MKFLHDMGISPRVGESQRSHGHLASHASDLGLHRATDREIFDVARSTRSILLTQDLDFGSLLGASGARLPSVVIFRLRQMQPALVFRYLQAVVADHSDSLEEGAVLIVAKRGLRKRSLPIVVEKASDS